MISVNPLSGSRLATMATPAHMQSSMQYADDGYGNGGYGDDAGYPQSYSPQPQWANWLKTHVRGVVVGTLAVLGAGAAAWFGLGRSGKKDKAGKSNVSNAANPSSDSLRNSSNSRSRKKQNNNYSTINFLDQTRNFFRVNWDVKAEKQYYQKLVTMDVGSLRNEIQSLDAEIKNSEKGLRKLFWRPLKWLSDTGNPLWGVDITSKRQERNILNRMRELCVKQLHNSIRRSPVTV